MTRRPVLFLAQKLPFSGTNVTFFLAQTLPLSRTRFIDREIVYLLCADKSGHLSRNPVKTFTYDFKKKEFFDYKQVHTGNILLWFRHE